MFLRRTLETPVPGRDAHSPRLDARAGEEAPLEQEPFSGPVRPIAGVRGQRASIAAVAVLAFVAAAWVASALWAGLLLGVLVAFAIEPAHRRIARGFPRSPALAAAATVSALFLAAGGLLAAVGAVIAAELSTALASLQDYFRHAPPVEHLRPALKARLDALGIPPWMLAERLERLVDRAADLASEGLSVMLGSTLHILAGALIALVTAFYTLKDRSPIERRLQQLLPLHPRITCELVEEFRRVGRGTLIGSAVAGLVQGVFAAIGYALGGVPRPLLLGLLTAVASLVPVFGTLLVWVPVGAVLLLTGSPGAGLFQIVWGILITTSLVDYVLRPVLVGKESRSHPLLFLVGLIGGVEILGAVGIIAGPIVMAFFVSVLRIYRSELVARFARAGCATDAIPARSELGEASDRPAPSRHDPCSPG